MYATYGAVCYRLNHSSLNDYQNKILLSYHSHEGDGDDDDGGDDDHDDDDDHYHHQIGNSTMPHWETSYRLQHHFERYTVQAAPDTVMPTVMWKRTTHMQIIFDFNWNSNFIWLRLVETIAIQWSKRKSKNQSHMQFHKSIFLFALNLSHIVW